MKVGIIRCMQTEDYCPGMTDFKMIREIKVIGCINCGDCLGKKAILRAREFIKHEADTIAFASCIPLGSPHILL